jgi:hypothetical protein
VLLYDKTINKLVGYRLYDEKDELKETTLFGYNSGLVESLCAIQTTKKLKLQSGEDVDMETTIQLTDMKIDINL